MARERRASSIHEVSADFLRLNGSRQQFRSLLSRKKLGQMPPAYTRIDYSHDSIESGHGGARTTSTGHHPEIRVEEAGGCIGPSQLYKSASAPYQHQHRLSISSVLLDSQKSSLEMKAGENGGVQPSAVNFGSQALCPPNAHGNLCLKRNNSRYAGPIDESAVKLIYKIRSQRLQRRVQITDRCVIMAMIGIVLMVLDTELCGQRMFKIDKHHPASLGLRGLVVLSTIALLFEIIHFHINEVLLDLVDCGADDFRVVLTWRRIFQFSTEFLLCSFCPLPFTGTVSWMFVEPARFRDDQQLYTLRDVPVDVLLSLLMLSRVYLIGRFMVLHSKQFQDASTRTLAALNRITVNFSFVVKTVLDQRPVVFLSGFLVIFWLATAWTFAQCERLGHSEDPSILYTNALWFIAITFNGNGYGDIIPKTIMGKAIAISVGIFGAVVSSILIAVISRKILLSQGQRNVNSFMNDSRLIQRHKDAAARVLQKTWHIYKCLQSADTPDYVLRKHQRKFLDAIYAFRKIKNKIRVFNEDSSTSFQQMNRLMTEMHTSMQKLVNSQEEMRSQIGFLQRAMRNHFSSGGGDASPAQQRQTTTRATMTSPSAAVIGGAVAATRTSSRESSPSSAPAGKGHPSSAVNPFKTSPSKFAALL